MDMSPSRRTIWAVARCLVLAALGSLIPASGQRAAAEPVAPAADSSVSYDRDIKPIFREHCWGCHQNARPQGDYRMTDFAGLIAGGESGDAAIVPGQPDSSYLLAQITPHEGEAAMPQPPAAPLSAPQIDLVRRWIAGGAIDDSPAAPPAYDLDNPPQYFGPPTLAGIDSQPGGHLIAATGHHEVLLIDSASLQVAHRLIGNSPRLSGVAFSPTGDRLAAVGGRSGEGGEVQIWEVEGGQLLLSKHLSHDTLFGPAWSPDGRLLAFGGADNAVRAIDAATGEIKLYQGAHEDWVLDTTFTPSGKHVVSVARDMTCKLTEVATQRFVDNVTSITPGALSGGLSAVAIHPSRDEIVVGGADGVAKVYRIFRQTERKIGDDANLIRNLPALSGRIFSVAISPDGARVAAAATLDRRSQIRVWSYDFDGQLSDDIKAVLAKRDSERSAEDNAKIAALVDAPVQTLATLDLPCRVYALAFGQDGQLIVGGGDNRLYAVDGSGQVRTSEPLVEIAQSPQLTADAAENADAAASVAAEQKSTASDGDPVFAADKIEVSPPSIALHGPFEYAQLVVTAHYADGSARDVTALSVVTPPAFLRTEGQRLHVRGEGEGEAIVRFGNLEQRIPVAAAAAASSSVDFISDVNPVLSKLGCNQGTCHGAQAGKNGFKLSLRGYDPIFDLRALTDELTARRINTAAPLESLMLRKPLGITPHEGGVLMHAGDDYHRILRQWIADGAELDLETPRVVSLELFPQNPVLQRPGDRQQVRLVATYADGRQRDVTREAFVDSGNTEVATAGGSALTAVRRGEAAILARYEGSYAATTLTVMGDREGFEESPFPCHTPIDRFVADKWGRLKIAPSPLCDDGTFLRRVYLDLTGLPPSSDEVREFVSDPTETRLKREAVVDRLLASDAYVEYWTNKWADLLQVNRKFLGVEGSQTFRDWIRVSVASGKPYDQFAHEILTAVGSNKDNPPASYFKILRDAETTMENTTHLFLGIRFNCNKCHDHPFERWTQDQYYQMGAFFAEIQLQRDPASGDQKIGGTAVESPKPLYEKVVDVPGGQLVHARTGQPASPEFPYEVPTAPAGDSRREQLAGWITSPDNPYFARSYVNRLWGYLMGTGLIEPIDDIRAGNPPTNPPLLDYLTEHFVAGGFDTRATLRLICNSRVYQLSVETNRWNADDTLNYSHAMPRRLPAEVIYDAVHAITGSTSSIPGVPAGTRAAALPDAGVSLPDGFLTNLGRPARESVCECERSSSLQLGPIMALVSGPTIGSAIADDRNDVQAIVSQCSSNPDMLAEEIYLRALARRPRPEELAAFRQVITAIADDHAELSQRLAAAEQQWEIDFARLEAERQLQLQATREQAAAREQAIAPEREAMARERQTRIDAAQAKLDEVRGQLAGKVNAYLDSPPASAEWSPLQLAAATATNKLDLLPQPDRSVIATGASRDKGVYALQYRSALRRITGLRLEAISNPALPAGGPGLGANGNFVVTEIVVRTVAADGKPGQQRRIKAAQADFTQDGFDIAQTFDEASRDQRGWAVSGSLGVPHWAVFELAEPIELAEGERLLIEMHQFHNAADHRLGHFRWSATADAGPPPLGLPEPFAAFVALTPEQRSTADLTLLTSYLGNSDADIAAAAAAVNEAKKPLPPDAELERLRDRVKQLEIVTPTSESLVQLRQDHEHSARQSQRPLHTAAEDLLWALVNSPAFLFNH